MMTYAWMALLSAAAMLLLARPWWQRGAVHLQRRTANITAYKTRLAEIETDIAAGLLDQAAAEQLKQEQGARLLADAEAPAVVELRKTSQLWWAVLLLPVFAGTWYALAGSWRTQNLIELSAKDPAAGREAAVEVMVQRLAARLQQQPEDTEGWAMLGRSYFVLQRYTDAAVAYGRANEQSASRNPDWLVGEGEALAFSRDRDLQGRPQQLFQAALQLKPDHIDALWFAGLSAAQAGDYAATRQHWAAVLQLPIPDEMRQVIGQRLEELARLDGSAAPAAAPAPVSAAVELALQVEVSIAPELQAQLKPEQTLFVFAKAAQGPPMPLAVQKVQPATLPLKLRLDDSMSMMPSLKLSQFDRWTVTARLTAGGSVQAQSGDLEGTLTVSRGEAGKPLQLVINRKIP